MTTKQKISTIAMLLIVIGAVWYIYNQWVIFQAKVSDINGHFIIPIVKAQADNNTDVAVACQQEKDAMTNPDLPSDAYNNELPYYNSHCQNVTGGLPPQ